MKRQIRAGVFETNSSSQHSITVMKRNEKYTSEEILDGIYLCKDENDERCIWDIWEGNLEFGRSPFRTLGTFKNKWLYAFASLTNEYNGEIHKELERIAFKYIPGLKKIKLPVTTDYIINLDDDKIDRSDEYGQKYGMHEKEFLEFLTEKEKQWGFETYYWTTTGYFEYKRPYMGYVDEDILSGFLEKKNISLEEFITNKKYVVVIDGDEYNYWHDIKEAGLINMDAIDYEFPDYKED